MITYYEMIDYIEKMKTSPRDEKKINFLSSHKIYTPGNVLYRFIDHIVDLIRTRLNKALDNFILKIKTIGKDENLFSLEILEIKKEINYVVSIAKSVNIPEENRHKLKETIMNFANEVEEILENNAKRIDQTGKFLSIVKSHKLNKMED